MHRQAARRPRLVALVLTALAACGGAERHDDALPAAQVVHVAAQPCEHPNRAFGLGVVVAEGLVATAAHTVDGALRTLTVDDVPAAVVAIEPRTDLAPLAADIDGPPVELSTAAPAAATLLGPDGPIAVEIEDTGTLVVHDATDRRRYERQAHVFTPGVAEGASGSPLVDGDGKVLGIVVLDSRRGDNAYAVTAAELTGLMAELGDRSGGGRPSMVEGAGASQGRNTCDDR
jgi:S1-C subfamily serine protease